jgi:hypothetical protein
MQRRKSRRKRVGCVRRTDSLAVAVPEGKSFYFVKGGPIIINEGLSQGHNLIFALPQDDGVNVWTVLEYFGCEQSGVNAADDNGKQGILGLDSGRHPSHKRKMG